MNVVHNDMHFMNFWNR